MNCQRCTRGEEARYVASSDVMHIKVCGPCAAEAWKLGLMIEALEPREVKRLKLSGRR
jgi:hypothetical protein